MKRWQVLLVAVAAFVLVSRGSRDSANPVGIARPAALSAEAIGAIVGSANPHLSPAERRGSAARSCAAAQTTGSIPSSSPRSSWSRAARGRGRSRRRARSGLMQVMPHMTEARILAGNLTTIESNVEAGCSILADNIRRLGEDDGISAYFWGSDIRGVAYLDRVRAARATVRRLVES